MSKEICCDWHSYMVGDGCPICNPEKAAEIEEENRKEENNGRNTSLD